MEWSIRSERYFAKKKAALEKKQRQQRICVPRRMRGKPRPPEDVRMAEDALNAADYLVRKNGRKSNQLHYRRKGFV